MRKAMQYIIQVLAGIAAATLSNPSQAQTRTDIENAMRAAMPADAQCIRGGTISTCQGKDMFISFWMLRHAKWQE
jgi:hypothetical protein